MARGVKVERSYSSKTLEIKKKMKIFKFPSRSLGWVGLMFILLIIWNRLLRKRMPYSLVNEFTLLTQWIMQITCIIILIVIFRKVYLIFFYKEQLEVETKENSGNGDGDTLKERILFRIQIVLNRIYSKLLEIKIFKNLMVIQQDPGVYNYVLINFFILIENYIPRLFFEKIFSLLICKHHDLRNLLKKIGITERGTKKIQDICYNSWIKFLYGYSYYMFKFIPIMFVHSIGFYEIFINYKLYYYYNALCILLIPFLIDVIYKHQQYVNTNYINRIQRFQGYRKKLFFSTTDPDGICKKDNLSESEDYLFGMRDPNNTEELFIIPSIDNHSREYVVAMTVPKGLAVYNLQEIYVFHVSDVYSEPIISREFPELQYVPEDQRVDVYYWYISHIIRKEIAVGLRDKKDKGYPKLDLLLSGLTFTFLICLLYY